LAQKKSLKQEHKFTMLQKPVVAHDVCAVRAVFSLRLNVGSSDLGLPMQSLFRHLYRVSKNCAIVIF